MDAVDLLRMLAAFGITMGLFFAGVWGFRKFAPNVIERLKGSPATARRLNIVETLVLGPQQRLVLVSLDGAERLVLLGGGEVLDQPKKSPLARKVMP
jgi:flagellar biogenesis protein FliO